METTDDKEQDNGEIGKEQGQDKPRRFTRVYLILYTSI